MSSLAEALAAARAELEQLRARETAQLEASGLRETVQQLTAENQLLSLERDEARARLDSAREQLAGAREHRAMLELQIKGARSRVQKLTSAVGPHR